MKTEIYYFTATGNSLAVAKDLKDELGGEVTLISITDLVNRGKELDIKCDRFGIIYPVYAWGLPRIVYNFFKLINKLETSYNFGIATCGGTPASTLIFLGRELDNLGAVLNAGFFAKLPSNGLGGTAPICSFFRKIRGKESESWDDRKNEIVKVLNSSMDSPIELQSKLSTFAGKIVHPEAIKAFSKLDSGFSVSNSCTGCGTCQKVCPAKNIAMIDGKPDWNSSCEQCYACLNWCPKGFIEYGKESIGLERYHHSSVKLNEIIKQ